MIQCFNLDEHRKEQTLNKNTQIELEQLGLVEILSTKFDIYENGTVPSDGDSTYIGGGGGRGTGKDKSGKYSAGGG